MKQEPLPEEITTEQRGKKMTEVRNKELIETKEEAKEIEFIVYLFILNITNMLLFIHPISILLLLLFLL